MKLRLASMYMSWPHAGTVPHTGVVPCHLRLKDTLFVLSLHLFHLFFSARIGVMSHMTCHVDAGVDKVQTSQAHSHLSPAPMQSFLTPSDPK